MVQLSVGTPQHVSVWSVLTAHVKPLPEETWLKVPGGALVSPDKLSPQQARVASVRTAHAWEKPEETWLKVPVGMVQPSVGSPQQTRVPSVRIPQVKFEPAEMAPELGIGAALAVTADATKANAPSATSAPRTSPALIAALPGDSAHRHRSSPTYPRTPQRLGC